MDRIQEIAVLANAVEVSKIIVKDIVGTEVHDEVLAETVGAQIQRVVANTEVEDVNS